LTGPARGASKCLYTDDHRQQAHVQETVFIATSPRRAIRRERTQPPPVWAVWKLFNAVAMRYIMRLCPSSFCFAAWNAVVFVLNLAQFLMFYHDIRAFQFMATRVDGIGRHMGISCVTCGDQRETLRSWKRLTYFELSCMKTIEIVDAVCLR
jgi:hypothetical protein